MFRFKIFFGVKREILLKTWENANKEIWKNLSFCFAHLSPKRKWCFSKQKWKIHFLKRPEKSKNECLKEQFLRFSLKREEIQKNNFGDVRKGFFWWEFFFRKNKIGKGNKEKRQNQKGEEQLKGFHRKRWKEEMIKETETRRFCNNNRERIFLFFFFFERSVWQQKKESNNEEGGQREREHQEGTYKGVKTWKESTDRKRNEKHKYKHEDDQNGNLNREIFLLARNTKNEIKSLEKKEFVFENVEHNEEWDNKTRYFVERDRNRRKMAKTKQAQTNIFLRKKEKWTQEGKNKEIHKKEK